MQTVLYDVQTAIEVGRMLEAHNVSFFEEPCPWQDYEQTKQVTSALRMAVAGGEQDTSLLQFGWIIRNRVVDLIQPDVYYNGGLIRTLHVAQTAEQAGMKVALHSPRAGGQEVGVLHLAAVIPNLWEYQEYPAHAEVRQGQLEIPYGAGLGAEYEPRFLWRAKKL